MNGSGFRVPGPVKTSAALPARLPAPESIAAMNSINVVAVTPLFMTMLFGAALACVIVAGSALSSWQRPGSGYLFVGSVFYLLGTILVTMICNVPRNNALAALDPASLDEVESLADSIVDRGVGSLHCRAGKAALNHRAIPPADFVP